MVHLPTNCRLRDVSVLSMDANEIVPKLCQKPTKNFKTQSKQIRTQDCFHSDEHWGKCNQIRQVRTKTRCDNAVYHCVKHMRNHHFSDFLPKIIWEKNGSKHYKWKSVIQAWEYAKVCPRKLVKVNGTYVVIYIRKKIYLLFFYADSVLDGFLKFIKNHTNFLGHLKKWFYQIYWKRSSSRRIVSNMPIWWPCLCNKSCWYLNWFV